MDFAERFASPPTGSLAGLVCGIAYLKELGAPFAARRVEILSSPLRMGRPLRMGTEAVSPEEVIEALSKMYRHDDAIALYGALGWRHPLLRSVSLPPPKAGYRVDILDWARLQAPPDGPAPSDAHLRRILCLPYVTDMLRFRLLASLPEAWIPRDDDERDAFVSLCGIFRSVDRHRTDDKVWRDHDLALMLGGYGFLNGVRGRWRPFLDRLGPATHERHVRIEGVTDMVRAFAEDVVIPTLIRTDLYPNDYHDVHAFVPPVAIAARVLFEDKGINAILEESAAWHRDVAANPVAARGPDWGVPFDELTAPNGLVLRCLGSEQALFDEGLAMRHCVGTYGSTCRAGHSVIVSIAQPDGTRISTLDLRPAGGTWKIWQNLGPLNAQPPRESIEAAEWLLREHGSLARQPRRPAGNLPYAARMPDFYPVDRRPDRRVRWTRYLRRPLRQDGGLDAAILRAGVHVLRTRFDPGGGIGPDGTPDNTSLDWHRRRGPCWLSDFDIETWTQLRATNIPYARRVRFARVAAVGYAPLPMLVSLFALLPLVPSFGPSVVAPALLALPAALAWKFTMRMPWAARRARRHWERRALSLAENADPQAVRTPHTQAA